jgi:hypothetical protein
VLIVSSSSHCMQAKLLHLSWLDGGGSMVEHDAMAQTAVLVAYHNVVSVTRAPLRESQSPSVVEACHKRGRCSVRGCKCAARRQ